MRGPCNEDDTIFMQKRGSSFSETATFITHMQLAPAAIIRGLPFALVAISTCSFRTTNFKRAPSLRQFVAELGKCSASGIYRSLVNLRCLPIHPFKSLSIAGG